MFGDAKVLPCAHVAVHTCGAERTFWREAEKWGGIASSHYTLRSCDMLRCWSEDNAVSYAVSPKRLSLWSYSVDTAIRAESQFILLKFASVKTLKTHSLSNLA